MNKTVYKVVQINPDGDMFSCCMNTGFPEAWRCRYVIGKTTWPKKKSKLFAFPDAALAKTFIELNFHPFNQHRMRILACTARVSAVKLIHLPAFPDTDWDLDGFWSNVKAERDIGGFGYPTATVLCNYITPKRIVDVTISGEL